MSCAVLRLHPRFEVNGDRGVILETGEPTNLLSLDGSTSSEVGSDKRTEPDFDVYVDTLGLSALLSS